LNRRHESAIFPAVKPFKRVILPVFLVLAVLVQASVARADSNVDSQRAKVRAMRDSVLAELYSLHPGARSKIGEAAGYAVFSDVGVNLVFASFAGGHGVVVKKGLLRDTETFMKMGSAGLGLGLGVKDFRAVFIFYDKARLDAFIDKGWDFSGQADAAAKSDDKGAAYAGADTIVPGVEVYQITKNGLALQATLQGTKYWKDDDLN
jgi:lipid-binding SYLF domain-containing protein